MLVVDRSKDNGTVDVHVGDSFQLQLAESPTTGYRWHLQLDGPSSLRVVDDSFDIPQGGYGGGGLRRWTFAADNPGLVALRMELRRGPQSQPFQTFNVAVNVK